MRSQSCRALLLWAFGWLFCVGWAAAGSGGLIDAVRSRDAAAVRVLLAEQVAINAPAIDGATALHWAVHLDDLELVELLLEAKADVGILNRYGVTVISLASENGSADVLDRLLRAGADANASLRGGETALMTAARSGDPEALRVLLEHGADVHARDEVHGQTAMMWAAAQGHASALGVLAKAGGDINARTQGPPRAASRRGVFGSPSPTGFTPLLFATREGRLDAVRLLVEAGADVNDALSDGQSALIVAAANANWELMDFLLDRGADPKRAEAGWNALHQIVRTRRMNVAFGPPGPLSAGTVDSIDVIRKMIRRGVDLDARMARNGMKDGQRNRLNRLGATAFFLAAKVTDVEAMRVLIEAGADPLIPNAENTTPLMVAAGLDIWNPGEDGGSLPGQEEEVLEAVRMCVALGNDVNAKNVHGETALHGAAFRGVNIVVEYLVEQGAGLDARDRNGWIPWAIANGFSYTDFYKSQKHTATLLAGLMQDKGLSTAGEAIPGSVCFDCLQTRRDQAQAERQNDDRMEAEFRDRQTPGSSR